MEGRKPAVARPKAGSKAGDCGFRPPPAAFEWVVCRRKAQLDKHVQRTHAHDLRSVTMQWFTLWPRSSCSRSDKTLNGKRVCRVQPDSDVAHHRARGLAAWGYALARLGNVAEPYRRASTACHGATSVMSPGRRPRGCQRATHRGSPLHCTPDATQHENGPHGARRRHAPRRHR